MSLSGPDFRKMRKQLGLSQSALADTLGKSRRTIVRAESAAEVPRDLEAAIHGLATVDRLKRAQAVADQLKRTLEE